jgi:hypothetical protein
MERICGDATIAGVEAALAAGVPRFVFVSVHDYNIPSALKDQSGYFSACAPPDTRVELQPAASVVCMRVGRHGAPSHRRVPLEVEEKGELRTEFGS